MTRRCPYCNQAMPVERRVNASEQVLLAALRHPSERIYGRNQKPCKPWLYAAADQYDTRKADRSRWYVTGPEDRKGYIKGPFSEDQVARVAATGKLRSVCRDDDGRSIAYELVR